MATKQDPNVVLPSRQAAYMREVKSLVQSLWSSVNELKARQREWDALDYGTTLLDPTAVDGNELKDITAENVGACVFASTDAILAVFEAGTATNLARLLS